VNIWKKDVMDSHRETKVGIEPPAVNDKVLELEGQATELENKSAEATSEVQAVSK
jgi:FHS family L-fucose permease-like MFS transporter